jgi:3-deoxy-7-phosphoheptulonate synthase
MIIVMRAGATAQEIAVVVDRVERMGFRAHLSQGEERTIIGVIGDERPVDPGTFELLDGVERTVPILRPFKLASRDFHPADSVFSINGTRVGGMALCIMAGPCTVESRQQIIEVAHAVKEAGAHVLRGGAFKPRTSPYSFQGLGLRGLELLAEARAETGLPIVTEVMAPDAVSMVAQYADILQVGTRNMQNYALLQAVGKANVPVLLKRGMMSTIEELLMSAEYILANGNPRVILCERGIRTFERYTRNTLDINAIPSIKQLTHLPVIADPSHGTGKWDLVVPVSRACIAAGADGLIIEVHSRPEEAMSDQAQQIRPEVFAKLMADLKALAPLLGRTL